jgi:hypothetical protein
MGKLTDLEAPNAPAGRYGDGDGLYLVVMQRANRGLQSLSSGLGVGSSGPLPTPALQAAALGAVG